MRLALVLWLAACGQMYQQPGGSSSTDPRSAVAEPTPAARSVEGKAPTPTAAAKPAASSPAPQAEPSPSPAPQAKPAAPAPAEPAASSGAKPGSAAQQWVDAHNRYRAKHCAPPLAWSPKLAEVAQRWADTLKAKGCAFGHSPGAKYGENLAGGTSGALDPTSATTMWYDEIQKYKFPNGGFSMETGHFTQVVWTTTKHVGCGQVTCKGMDIYVCNYDPPGNWEGQYRQHVLPLGCKK